MTYERTVSYSAVLELGFEQALEHYRDEIIEQIRSDNFDPHDFFLTLYNEEDKRQYRLEAKMHDDRG